MLSASTSNCATNDTDMLIDNDRRRKGQGLPGGQGSRRNQQNRIGIPYKKKMASSDSTQRPAKRTKLIGASDGVAIDVGGTKFVAAASTLTSNSAYFASLLSGNWNEAHADGHEIGFLDQDPVPFGKLLAFMRRGLIKVDEIDADVLALANFLGVERLLLAVKIRAYQHFGSGPRHVQSQCVRGCSCLRASAWWNTRSHICGSSSRLLDY